MIPKYVLPFISITYLQQYALHIITNIKMGHGSVDPEFEQSSG